MDYPGVILKRGSKGEAVKALQKKLGCDPDGDFGPMTERAVKSFQATHVDQQGNPLLVDGHVGPITWATIFGEAKPITKSSTDLGDMAVKIALSQEGVREHGNNSGPEVNKYLASVGLPPGQPWCMAFVHWCFKEASEKLNCENLACCSGSCSAVFRWARTKGKLTDKPEPGDIFLVKGGKTGHCHTGIVVGTHGGFIDTIEGNTNKFGSAEGLYVMRRMRKANSCDYVRVG